MNSASREVGRAFPWKSAGLAFALVGAAYAVAFLGLALAGIRDPSAHMRDLSASIVLAASSAVLVAVMARRHREKAQPWRVFLLVWVSMVLLIRVVDWTKEW